MPIVHSAAGAIFYLARGNGPPIIAIHGAAGASRQWGEQLPALGQYARVIAPDLPGHGRSTGAPLHRIADGAAQIVALLDALGIERAVLLGHSMGGAIAQMLALHEKDRVRGLALVGSAAQLPISDALLHDITTNWPAAARNIVDLAYARGTDDAVKIRAAHDLARVDRSIAVGDYAACAAFDLRERLHEIKVPVLTISGLDDGLVPVWLSELTTNALPNGTLAIVQAGHMPMIEQAEVVNRVLIEWLELHEFLAVKG